jgi:serine/threonine protein kinase
MYQDQLLFLAGAVASVLFVVLIAFLMVTRKKNRLFRQILIEETEASEAINVLTRSRPIVTIENLLTESTSVNEDMTQTDFDITEDKDNLTSLDDDSVSSPSGTASGKVNPIGNFNPEILKGQYTLLREIGGGGMSRVFLARKDNVGNEWIIKYVPTQIGEFSAEADILQSLNHISLPKIIDIMHDNTGSYMVVSYVEGTGMNDVLKSMKGAHEFTIADWAQQLAQVLAYLHKTGPVYHLDLKPSNVMVTSDNKLVLIDFGISRRATDDGEALGVTAVYAAPEQLKGRQSEHTKEIIRRRFGTHLPGEQENWPLNDRTDIYSFGVIMYEAAVGHIPTFNTLGRIKAHLSPGLSDIILKCLAPDPADRYQTTEDLLAAIYKHRTQAKPTMMRSLLVRRAAMAMTAVFLIVAAVGFVGGMRVMQAEAAAYMYVHPGIITVSLQQDSAIEIKRHFPHTGRKLVMNPASLRWEFTADIIAQVDGNRVIGLNTGQTIIHGRYRNDEITLVVNVVEPMRGMVDISLRYHGGGVVHRYAGTGNRDMYDGTLADMEMVGPESMAVTADGSIYFTDRGRLRKITPAGFSETLSLEPTFQRFRRVRTAGDAVYVLTDPWLEEDGSSVYAIKRVTANTLEEIYRGNGRFSDIRDFDVTADGLIYFVEWNYAGGTRLRVLEPANPDSVRTLYTLPTGAYGLTVGGGYVFIADPEMGNVFAYRDGQLHTIAGLAGERHFIDGPAPLFYRPTRLRYRDGGLYVWDFNVLRRLDLLDGAVQEAVTVAGMVSPEYSREFVDAENAERIVLPYSYLTEFVFVDDEILISDPVRGLVWRVVY